MRLQELPSRRRAPVRATMAAAIAFIASSALAAENDWTSLNAGNWSTGANWSLGVPVNGQDVFIGHGPPNEGNPDLNVTFDATLTGLGLFSLNLDSQSVNGYVIFNQTTGGTAMIANNEVFGATTPDNTYNQSAGSNTAGIIYLGETGSFNNNYNLSGTGTLTAGFEDVGYSGPAAFLQTNGTNTVSNQLYLGGGNGVTGTYTLSGGNLAVTNAAIAQIIGFQGNGTFTQSGGTFTLAGGLTFGYSSTATGVYNLSGSGILNENSGETVGSVGTGIFNQTGGTHTVNGTLAIANAPGSHGTYNLQSGVLSAATIQLNTGGTFNQTGGTISATTTFNHSGGTVTGTLQNLGTFNYNSGTFSGRLLNQGAVNFNADFTAGNGMENDTSVTIGAGRTVTLNGSGLDNEGLLTLAGGTLTGSGLLSNSTRISGYGAISGSGGFYNYLVLTQNGGNLTLSNAGPNINLGTIDLAAGYQMRLNAALSNAGTLNLNSAAITGSDAVTNAAGGTVVGPGSMFSFNNSGGVMVVPAGTTNISLGSNNSGVIQLTSPASNLNGGTINNSGAIQGQGTTGNAITNTGTIAPNGGSLNIGGTLNNNAGGTIRLAAGSQAVVISGLATNSGTISLTGGTFDNNGHALSNANQISGYGTLSTGGLTNNGSITLTGGVTTINGDLTNAVSKTLKVQYNPAIFTGNVTNNGTFKVTGTTVSFAGTFTNSGTYNSDPATNYFSSLTVGSSGALSGGAGDQFIVANDFSNSSTQTRSWNTTGAELAFSGSAVHHLLTAAADLGPNRLGYINNFAFGDLTLAAGESLVLETANGGPGAFYVSGLHIEGGISQIASITGNGLNLYYDPANPANSFLGDQTYSLDGGGSIAPVPEPMAAVPLLAAAGLLLRRRTSKR